MASDAGLTEAKGGNTMVLLVDDHQETEEAVRAPP